MKNNLTLIVAALTAIICAAIIGYAYKNRGNDRGVIEVTGLGKRDFASDLIVWNGTFSRKAMDMKSASDAINNDRNVVQQYLQSKGIKSEDMVFDAVQIEREYDYPSSGRVFTGFRLSQQVKIESQAVDKVEALSREVSTLIDQGIEFTSNAPSYFYTKLAELKLEMIEEATKDAKLRAEKAAEYADAGLGRLRSADMGVFQITGQNSTEDYSWGGAYNTSSKKKTATVTMTLRYGIR